MLSSVRAQPRPCRKLPSLSLGLSKPSICPRGRRRVALCPSVLNPFLPIARSFCSLLYSLASGAHTGGRRCRSENTFLRPPTTFSDRLAGQILAWKSFSFRTWKAVLLPPRFPCEVEKTEGVQAPNPLPVTCLSPFLRCAGSLPEPSRTADDVH